MDCGEGREFQTSSKKKGEAAYKAGFNGELELKGEQACF